MPDLTQFIPRPRIRLRTIPNLAQWCYDMAVDRDNDYTYEEFRALIAEQMERTGARLRNGEWVVKS